MPVDERLVGAVGVQRVAVALKQLLPEAGRRSARPVAARPLGESSVEQFEELIERRGTHTRFYDRRAHPVPLRSDDALREHGVRHALEAGGVRADDVVARTPVALGGMESRVVHVRHDRAELVLAVGEAPPLA